MLCFDRYGSGNCGVIILNDWIGDVSANWQGIRQYLDPDYFTWVFADLRGYGLSRGQQGMFSLPEAVADVLALAKHLGWQKFSIVGHSMSSLVALHLAQHHADVIERAVMLTPPPPGGFGVDETAINTLRAIALGDDEKRFNMLSSMWGDRLSPVWIRFKVDNWRRGADSEAAANYVFMFARDGVPEPQAKVMIPLLAITGEQDSELMRQAAVTALLQPLNNNLIVEPLTNTGHYPMQEEPPRLATLLGRFLSGAVLNKTDSR